MKSRALVFVKEPPTAALQLIMIARQYSTPEDLSILPERLERYMHALFH